MTEFLEIDGCYDIDLCYINRGDTIEGRLYLHFINGGNCGYYESFPRSCVEINQLNQILFEIYAKEYINHYIRSKEKTIPNESIVRVLERAPTLKNCLGVVAEYNGDDTYTVVFQQGLVVCIGVHFIEAIDPVRCAECTWDITDKWTQSGIAIMKSLSRGK